MVSPKREQSYKSMISPATKKSQVRVFWGRGDFFFVVFISFNRAGDFGMRGSELHFAISNIMAV